MRRKRLQVNTFPFLAVLLCTMGSLILILLVMDRRARLAALRRGQDEVGQVVSERAEAIAARERENSRRRGEAKVAYDRKKAELEARLDAEQRALDADMKQVQGRLAEIARELRGEEGLVGKLRADIRAEQTRLASHEEALEAARKEAADLGGKLSAADRARHKLAADAVQLKQVIHDLGEARKRDAMTYSVVPYNGKQGEKRRPLYVECGATGLVFHPDKLTLTEPAAQAVRDEVTRRAAALAEQRKKAGLKDERAYLLMLVRPDGIQRFYQMQSALRDLPVEFGYEFVDQDWKLTVPDVVESAGAAPAEKPKAAANLGAPAVASPGAGAAAPASGPRPADGPALEIELPKTSGTIAAPPAASTPPPLSAANPPSETPRLTRLPGALAGPVPAAKPGPDLGPTPPRTLPQFPARAGEPVVFVECRSDGVVVHPSGKSFGIDSLNHSPAHNPVYQAVVSTLAKQAGDPKLRAVRFLVHPDGERTFGLAAPAFNGVGATRTRHGLRPDEDVSRIVAGE